MKTSFCCNSSKNTGWGLHVSLHSFLYLDFLRCGVLIHGEVWIELTSLWVGSSLTLIPLLDPALTHPLITPPGKKLFSAPLPFKSKRREEHPICSLLLNSASNYKALDWALWCLMRIPHFIFTPSTDIEKLLRIHLQRMRCIQICFIAWEPGYS